MVTRSEFRTTCEECGVPLYEEGQRYSCPCCNQPICRKCHRQLKQAMVTRRELELDLIVAEFTDGHVRVFYEGGGFEAQRFEVMLRPRELRFDTAGSNPVPSSTMVEKRADLAHT